MFVASAGSETRKFEMYHYGSVNPSHYDGSVSLSAVVPRLIYTCTIFVLQVMGMSRGAKLASIVSISKPPLFSVDYL